MAEPVACGSCGTRNRIPPAATGTPRCAACKAPLPWVVEAGDRDFEALAAASVPVLIDFWASWCGPCKALGPAVEAAAVELAGELKVLKVNVDEAPGLSARYQVQAVPTLVVQRDGLVLARQPGAVPAAALMRWLRSVLAGQAA